MNTAFAKARAKTMKRLAALFDGSAWFLIAPFFITWLVLDPVDAKASMVWLLRLPIVVGVSIILSRVVFPTLKLGDLVREARAGSVGAGLVVLGLLLNVGLMFIVAAGWAK